MSFNHEKQSLHTTSSKHRLIETDRNYNRKWNIKISNACERYKVEFVLQGEATSVFFQMYKPIG